MFPWLKDDEALRVEVDTKPWFTDADNDVLTYYCLYSDGTPRPSWIGYNTQTGQLRGFPKATDPSEYMNLQFTAIDTKKGSYTYYKALLVDAAPKANVLYVTLYAS